MTPRRFQRFRRRDGQGQLDFRARTRDGRVAKRPGRKPTGRRMDPRHRTRPGVLAHQPQHVVLRVTREVGNLRRHRAYRAIRGTIQRCAARSDYRVVHVSIQANHVHLLIEADDTRALSRGMQAFAISAAKRLNRELRRGRGAVFAFRYHATAITTPTQARNALAYVLNNWRRHRADRFSVLRADPYATGYAFWSFVRRPDDALPVVRATAWLLTDGFKRAAPIHTDEVPGPDPPP